MQCVFIRNQRVLYSFQLVSDRVDGAIGGTVTRTEGDDPNPDPELFDHESSLNPEHTNHDTYPEHSDHDSNLDPEHSDHDSDLDPEHSDHHSDLDPEHSDHDSDLDPEHSDHDSDLDAEHSEHDSDLDPEHSDHDSDLDPEHSDHDSDLDPEHSDHDSDLDLDHDSDLDPEYSDDSENSDFDADESMEVDDMFEPLYDGANITVCGAYCAIMEFKRVCRLPFSAIFMLLKLLQLLCPSGNKLPQSVYLLKKFFQKHSSQHKKRLYCPECNTELRGNQQKCTNAGCQGKEPNYLITMKPDRTIKNILRSK